ncbi:hypothetical protein JG687_00011072 [Phytophthora cactorum]|uniref:Uncharacterized protein n=1 Tax=Phytophthora cactorum TaxID=29920 RepID=A0A8T1U586_9STRA|nr:hypothetical protein JG687_00011072 [Phytophthora cactorum]
MFALHPEKIPSAACNFKLETTTAFNHLNVQLGADTDDLAQDVMESLSDAEYERDRRQIRRVRQEKAEGKVTFALPQDKLRTYRKQVEKHLASVDLHAANFQAKQMKAQVARDEEFAKLKKLIFLE